jgi:hypothetical protein
MGFGASVGPLHGDVNHQDADIQDPARWRRREHLLPFDGVSAFPIKIA